MPSASGPLVRNLTEVGADQIAAVGGKNASLGEMLRELQPRGIRVPEGFATTAEAYWRFVEFNGLKDRIAGELESLRQGTVSLETAGTYIRDLFYKAQFPRDLELQITEAYVALCGVAGVEELAVAVRSSATAEDLPSASFAGQQETFLNISGASAVLESCRRCMASLFNDRAISYRERNAFDHMKVALSVGVQRMVRADKAGAGVMFSMDTETGFPDAVRIEASWGLGELVVKGSVNPDSYMVFKPLLDAGKKPIIEKTLGQKARHMIYAIGPGVTTQIVDTPDADRNSYVLRDAEILQLSRWAVIIEKHYGRPMDIEWAKDGIANELFIVQARPETVQTQRDIHALRTYHLSRLGRRLLTGVAVGDAAAIGKVCKMTDPHDVARFPQGAVLVTTLTDPDWVPIMRKAAAVVTERGGRTSHAAIVCREFGLPAVIGAEKALDVLSEAQDVTVSCIEGDEGRVYDGIADIKVEVVDPEKLPKTRTKIMLNMANPAAAFRWWRLPVDGVGLARMEFVIANAIKVHPMALARFEDVKDEAARGKIQKLTAGYPSKAEYFIDRLSLGLGRIAASYFPRPVIIRMSDFKTNEYANLVGGAAFEPTEENPMLGFRGASRYYSPRYRAGFDLECKAIKRLREDMGFTNVAVMIPFCRTPGEADKVLAVMAANGLERGKAGLETYVMCEIPSNVILAGDFAKRFDGFSIGSNDLTQLVLGVDRDSSELAVLFDEQDQAVKWMIREAITAAHRSGAKIGLCGQAPSDHPAFAEFLVECGIDSISVSPDSFLGVQRHVAQAEARLSKASGSI